MTHRRLSVRLTFRNHPISALIIDGEPWFFAGDLLGALGYPSMSSVIRRLTKSQQRQHVFCDRSGSVRRAVLINEAGIDRLVKAASAADFLFWLKFEALPWIPEAWNIFFGDIRNAA